MPVSVSFWSLAWVERLADAEVGDQGVTLAEENVLRLDVAVDDPMAVGVVERIGRLRERSGARRRAIAASRD